MGGPPKTARGMGGRQVRTDEKFGNIFDHFAIEYVYPNGARATSRCRQIAGCWNQVGESVTGTKGTAVPGGRIDGEVKWRFKGKKGRRGPYVQEHSDLIASIRAGKPLNEAKRVAESTLTAIMGRMSAYTGKVVSWELRDEQVQARSASECRPQVWQRRASQGRDPRHHAADLMGTAKRGRTDESASSNAQAPASEGGVEPREGGALSRRRVLLGAAGTVAAAGLGAVGRVAAQPRQDGQPAQDPAPGGAPSKGKPFKLLYAPHFGMFRHHAGKNPVDQVQFMADEGFRALEDNGMPRKSVQMQEQIRKALDKNKMTMGVFVALAEFNKPLFSRRDKDAIENIQKRMRAAVEVGKRVGAKWCTVVPGGWNKRIPAGFQTSYVIDNLKRCCEILETSGLVMVLEPLNFRNHPGCFLTKIPQAYQICRAVNHPCCKILNDLYHQQIQEGNLIPNLQAAWKEIAYFQVGDNPGRKEPTTGEINYKNIFKLLHGRGFEGVVGMEHGNSKRGKEGERAVINAYREVDSF